MAIEVLGVEHIDLTVNNVARSTEFYGKLVGALGFRVLDQDEDVRWGNAYLTIAIRSAAARSKVRSLSRRAASPRSQGSRARGRRRDSPVSDR